VLFGKSKLEGFTFCIAFGGTVLFPEICLEEIILDVGKYCFFLTIEVCLNESLCSHVMKKNI
jgi:hypothetical protein